MEVGAGTKEGERPAALDRKTMRCDTDQVKGSLTCKIIGPILLDKFKGSISNLPYKPQIFIEWQLLCFELCPGHIGEHSRFGRSSKCIRTD